MIPRRTFSARQEMSLQSSTADPNRLGIPGKISYN